jgi:Ca2+-binding EF-hand superfamily protein
LSAAEHEAALASFRAHRDRRRAEWLHEQYDKDGDGVLSATEVAQQDADRAARAASREERRAEARRRALEAYDSDGDGVLSDPEKQAAREARNAYMKRQNEAMATLFDADGDGSMTDGERSTMHETIGSLFEEMHFVRSFDADGDHAVTVADMPAYMDLFAAGDGRADMDGNGIIDGADLAGFQQRALAPPDGRLAEALAWLDGAPPPVDTGFASMVMLGDGGAVQLQAIDGADFTFSGGSGTLSITAEVVGDGVDGAQVMIIQTVEEQKDPD